MNPDQEGSGAKETYPLCDLNELRCNLLIDSRYAGDVRDQRVSIELVDRLKCSLLNLLQAMLIDQSDQRYDQHLIFHRYDRNT